ncbi:DMT family transporter [Pseudoruegeria sp. SK021]|uniref:DMT family transporter n=1 Tax=Pseudoruegeria sp. SK021 TaxID=1933035 RepID=UPI000A249C48|nr:DMT family transporter [Pseudoruegeria sp. SK021]OSP54471.1 EamA family transporter [Pseudoruegeria sp. SK021]
MSPNVRGALSALLAFALYASHDVIVKLLGGVYSPVQILFFSVLLGFPFVTLMLIRDGQPGTLRPRHPWWTALRTLAALITGFCAFYAFSVLPLAQTYAIIFAAPLLVTILSIPVLGESVGLHRCGAVLVGLIGVLVVLRPGATELELGHAAAMTAAFFSALGSIVVRKIGRDERSVVLLLFPMLANIIVMGCLLPFVYKPMPLLHFGGLAAVAFLAFLATSLMIAAYRAGEAAIVAPMQYSQIIWAGAFGLLFFDEVPDVLTVVGACIIISSGLYIVFREGRRGASENRPVSATHGRHETGTYPRVSALLRWRSRGGK